MSSAAAFGISPTAACATATAASTLSHFWNLLSSSKVALISGLPYRPVSIGRIGNLIRSAFDYAMVLNNYEQRIVDVDRHSGNPWLLGDRCRFQAQPDLGHDEESRLNHSINYCARKELLSGDWILFLPE